MNFFFFSNRVVHQSAGWRTSSVLGHHLHPLTTGVDDQDIHGDFFPDTMICSHHYTQVHGIKDNCAWYKTLGE